jgi:hypothetical protein
LYKSVLGFQTSKWGVLTSKELAFSPSADKTPTTVIPLDRIRDVSISPAAPFFVVVLLDGKVIKLSADNAAEWVGDIKRHTAAGAPPRYPNALSVSAFI